MKHKRSLLRVWSALKLNFFGLAVGLVFYCLALTPSLLPSAALLSGFLAGFNFAIGYGIGLFTSWLWRRFSGYEPGKQAKRVAWRILSVLAVFIVAAYAVWHISWQNEMRRLVGETSVSAADAVIVIIVAFVSSMIFIKIGHLLGIFISYLNTHDVVRVYQKRHPFASAVSFLIAGFLLAWFVLFNGFIFLARGFYAQVNGWTDATTSQTASTYRSGGPGSLVEWETLGREGREFISGGPSESDLRGLNEAPPTPPVRVYVGMESAPTVRERARLAVRELQRTGAFERSVLGVFNATGTGWIEPQSADALEYIWNGDSAIVSVQYSYLPSWISFLADRDLAIGAGQELLDAVYEKWLELPEDDRPELLVHGLSLGAYGAQGDFENQADIQSRTDGALFVGSPSFSQPWSDFTEQRDRGSPQWQPIYDEGRVVRFASVASDLSKSNSAWERPRAVYLQHASDPVVWWSFDLLWREPDWLSEPRGPDVSPDMIWYPLTTFIQVTANLLTATAVPNGHGHNYGDAVSGAWAAIATPEDWDAENTAELKRIISGYPTRSILQFVDRDGQ